MSSLGYRPVAGEGGVIEHIENDGAADVSSARTERGTPRSRHVWKWVAVAVSTLVVALILIGAVLSQRPAPTAQAASAQLNQKLGDIIKNAGGRWQNAAQTSPWRPTSAKDLKLAYCLGDPSLSQYRETAIGPGYPDPDAVAAKVARRWSALGYSTIVIKVAGATAKEKDGSGLSLNPTTIVSFALASTRCF